MMTAAAYGATLAIGVVVGWCAAIAFYRTWRLNSDVLSHVPPAAKWISPDVPRAALVRCICPARVENRGVCNCASNGERNPLVVGVRLPPGVVLSLNDPLPRVHA